MIQSSIKHRSISLVIPAYNEQRHLKACLEAIKIQTQMPLEVIVVDNNSTDTTAKIARQYDFVTVVSELKQGIVYARDTGFNSARGEVIGRIDADTILPSDWVEYISRFYSDEAHKNMAWTGGCYFYNVRLPHFAGWLLGQIAYRWNRVLMGHYILFGSNMAIPNLLWRSIKGQTCKRLDVHEDLDLSIHLHRSGYKITYHEGLKVGLSMKRVRSNRSQLWPYLSLWPQTLRAHGLKLWILSWLGAVMLYVLSPVIAFSEWLARLFGRAPIED